MKRDGDEQGGLIWQPINNTMKWKLIQGFFKSYHLNTTSILQGTWVEHGKGSSQIISLSPRFNTHSGDDISIGT
jgi:hypothetical protein